MEDKIKELLEKVKAGAEYVGEKAEDLGSKVGEKVNRTVEVSRLNVKIFDMNASISADLRELGRIVYDTHRGKTEDSEQELNTLLETLDGKNEELAALKAQAADVKGGASCPVCGAVISRDSKFCKECGAPCNA